MPSDRPLLRASLDEDTYDRWRDYAAANGVTVAALVEAIGRHLDPAGRQPALLARAIAEARVIVAQRYDRRPAD